MLIQDIVRTASTHISEGAEAVAALVIVSGIVRGAWMYVSALFRSGVEVPATTIRLSVGTSRPRPREFLLAADILATAVAPTTMRSASWPPSLRSGPASITSSKASCASRHRRAGWVMSHGSDPLDAAQERAVATLFGFQAAHGLVRGGMERGSAGSRPGGR